MVGLAAVLRVLHSLCRIHHHSTDGVARLLAGIAEVMMVAMSVAVLIAGHRRALAILGVFAKGLDRYTPLGYIARIAKRTVRSVK